MPFDKIFERISFGKNVPEFEKKLIVENFKIKKFKKNTILINDNEDCDRLFFIELVFS